MIAFPLVIMRVHRSNCQTPLKQALKLVILTKATLEITKIYLYSPQYKKEINPYSVAFKNA